MIYLGLVLFLLTIIINGAARLLISSQPTGEGPLKPMRLAWRNTLVNTVMLSLTAVCTFITVSHALFLILGISDLWNGGKSLNLDFFTQLPKSTR